MIFITGGAFSGKRDYARDNFDASDFVKGLETFEKLCKASAVYDFQLFIKYCMENDLDAIAATEKLIKKNPDAIIISDEVGCGIVPIDAADRRWRELCGRVNCLLASRAETVVRVVCGIGRVMK